jgi:hypothetical protein
MSKLAKDDDKQYIAHILLLRAIIALLVINLLLTQGTTCFGIHTYLVVADLAGITIACCSIDPCFRKRCNLLF